MKRLYITIADPKNYGKLFPTDPTTMPTGEFETLSLTVFETAVAVKACLAGIPLEKVKEAILSAKKGLVGVGTGKQKEYVGEYAGQKDTLENTLIFTAKDDADFSLFRPLSKDLETIDLIYPKTDSEEPVTVAVVCAYTDF